MLNGKARYMSHEPTYFVLGGAGAMGRITVRDLHAFGAKARIVVADYNIRAAAEYAASFRSRRVTAVFADAGRPAVLARLLQGRPVLINCTQHDFNLKVMEAALRAGCHYLDLGGLFVWTRRQLKWNAKFKRAGLTAILGMGGSPGITNVMARHAADQLERVDAIRVRSGWVEFTPATAGLSFGFSAQTVLEELTLPAFAFVNGRFRRIPPRRQWEKVNFGRPFGTVECLATRHSEVATLPDSFRSRGCRHCDFKLGYDRGFVREVVRRIRQGWTLADFKKMPTPREQVDDCEALRVVVTGRKAGSGRRAAITMDCLSWSKPEWRASAGDINTGCPPAIVARMLAAGQITRRGVLAPENAVPVQPFFRALAERGMKVIQRRG
jgi:lysine 6-dehydrogenase